jgi:hypothetical protein
MCGLLAASCSVAGDCCGSLACEPSPTSARCCLNPGDACTSSADCCGQMLCDLGGTNTCACRARGQSCVYDGECCVGACTGGACS